MNPNLKGSLGEQFVIYDLLKQGYFVYNEVTKHSKVDLIVLDKMYTKMYKIQVKTVSSKGNKIEVPVRKLCLDKKYNSLYSKGQNDYYAVFILDKEIIFYIPEDLFLKAKSYLTFYIEGDNERNINKFRTLSSEAERLALNQ